MLIIETTLILRREIKRLKQEGKTHCIGSDHGQPASRSPKTDRRSAYSC